MILGAAYGSKLPVGTPVVPAALQAESGKPVKLNVKLRKGNIIVRNNSASRKVRSAPSASRHVHVAHNSAPTASVGKSTVLQQEIAREQGALNAAKTALAAAERHQDRAAAARLRAEISDREQNLRAIQREQRR